MPSALAVALIIALAGPGFLPAASPTPSWLDWILQLRMQIDQVVGVITDLREAFAETVNQWWQDGLLEVSHALALTDLQPIVNSVMATLRQLPADLRSELQHLFDRVMMQATSVEGSGGTAQTMRIAIAMDPRLRETELQSLSRQATTASTFALAAAAQKASDQIAGALSQSTAAIDASKQAAADAQTLERSVAGAQSSRALLQYLGEGLANLMRHQATIGGLLSQQLAARSQQEALSTRDLQLIVSLLAQDALTQEQARRGQVAANQEALRLLAEGYSQSLLAVGTSLLDLQGGTNARRRQLLDAITPTR